jgi:anti-sigma factor RsiW
MRAVPPVWWVSGRLFSVQERAELSSTRAIRPDDLQDYIEGRLDDARRHAVLAYLERHPEQAVEIEALRKQAEQLRRLGSEIVDEPIPRKFLEILQRLKH